jgi:Tfp pilus assembly pilus retraction ATPase PilT
MHYVECEDSSGDALLEVMKNGAAEGMQHFDQEIAKLVRAGVIDLEAALSHATDAQQLQRSLGE